MANNSNTGMAPPSAPIWRNWSGNLVHQPAMDGADYYFTPTNLSELQQVLAEAKKAGVTIRVSGQRHSQPPLVLEDSGDTPPPATKTYIVDLSCYCDLGTNHDQRIVLGPGEKQVTVNAGVREDELDAFLSEHQLMLQTVTAGGFFSLGGMTAVDVHGASLDAPIFAETVSSFTLLLADGTVTTIDENTPVEDGWSPRQFVRVSLGGLGIVTSMIIDVLERATPATLQGGTTSYVIQDKPGFVKEFTTILKSHNRVETFFTPYANMGVGRLSKQPSMLALWWDVVSGAESSDPTKPQKAPDNACVHAGKGEFGAPYLTGISKYGAKIAMGAQTAASPIIHLPVGAAEMAAIATFHVIVKEVAESNKSHSELWLTGAVRVMFMSYYIPIPDLEDAGLSIAWDGMDVVSKIVTEDDQFHIAAPMEFRFVKGGDSAMSGTFIRDTNCRWFVNLDLIGFVNQEPASQYDPKLLQFFADVEREWVKMGGFPHNGKMYGFYDPENPGEPYSMNGPFNPNFLAHLKARRGEPLRAFNDYRKKLDPTGLFYNEYLRQLLE